MSSEGRRKYDSARLRTELVTEHCFRYVYVRKTPITALIDVNEFAHKFNLSVVKNFKLFPGEILFLYPGYGEFINFSARAMLPKSSTSLLQPSQSKVEACLVGILNHHTNKT